MTHHSYNKTIYMTYKKDVPEIVFNRWKELNPEYTIDFSLDEDCICFLRENFCEYFAELFKTIPEGMYKADLWRICKLYIHGGVYADVDLVPYLNIDMLDKEITLYSILSGTLYNCISQAFIVNFSKPKNPLILQFILSFVLNHPYTYLCGPCVDMYNIIKYNLNNTYLVAETKYQIEEVKIWVKVGSSREKVKNVNLYFFPKDLDHSIVLNQSDAIECFNFVIQDNVLVVTRIDSDSGWDSDYTVNICIKSRETILLFTEKQPEIDDWVERHTKTYVTHNNNKILDFRDPNYYFNGGW